MSNTKTRTLKIVRTSTQPLRLEPGETVHVGVDVHKATYSVALYSPERGLLATWVQPARPEVLIERLRPVREAVGPGRLRGRADRLRPGPSPAGRGLCGAGHRPLEAAGPGRPGGQERPPGLPPAGPVLGQGPASPGPGPHRAGGGRSPGAAAPRAAGPQDSLGPGADQEFLAAAWDRRAGRPGSLVEGVRRRAPRPRAPAGVAVLPGPAPGRAGARPGAGPAGNCAAEGAGGGRPAPQGDGSDGLGAGGGDDHGGGLPPGAA